MLTRKSRTVQDLATYVENVGEALVGSSLSASEARSWAETALSGNGFDSYTDAPFTTNPDLVASYVPYFDLLTVEDTSVRRPDWAQLQSIGANRPLDMGIGATSAEATASAFLSSMEAGRVIASGPYVFAGSRYSRRALHRPSVGESYLAVSEYSFFYHRSVESLPILNSLVRVVVSREGKVKKVHVQDVDFSATTQLRTRISDDDAFASMTLQATSQLPQGVAPEESVLADKQIGYFLPADQTSATLAPVAKAKIFFRIGDVVTRARTGSISLDVERPLFSYLPVATRPPRPQRADGESCTDDRDCQSGFCYLFAGLGGICGECADGSTCTYGCDPPGVLKYPPVPSACGDGTLGAGCENDRECTESRVCSLVATAAHGFDLQACSQCAKDADCSGAEICGIVFDRSTQKAFRQCALPSARTLGAICESHADCSSNRCSRYAFPDGTSVGVCGECFDDSDCVSPGVCVGTSFDFEIGFSHSICQ